MNFPINICDEPLDIFSRYEIIIQELQSLEGDELLLGEVLEPPRGGDQDVAAIEKLPALVAGGSPTNSQASLQGGAG